MKIGRYGFLVIMVVLGLYGNLVCAQEFKSPVVKISDDFSTPQWQMIKGTDDPVPGAAEFVDGTISLVSSCMQSVNIDSIGCADFTGQVSFYIADGPHQQWESASLALFGEPTDIRAYFMVIFGKPGMKDALCDVGLYQGQTVKKNFHPGNGTLSKSPWQQAKAK